MEKWHKNGENSFTNFSEILNDSQKNSTENHRRLTLAKLDIIWFFDAPTLWDSFEHWECHDVQSFQEFVQLEN